MDWDDLYIETFEELVNEYLDAHPNASEAAAEAYAHANLENAVNGNFENMIDYAHDMSRDI